MICTLQEKQFFERGRCIKGMCVVLDRSYGKKSGLIIIKWQPAICDWLHI